MKLFFEASQLPELAASMMPVVLDAAGKSVLLLALAGIVVLCLRRASSATRHWVWLLAMASLLLLPALSVILPVWHILPTWTDKVQTGPELRNTKPFVHPTDLHEAAGVLDGQDERGLPPGISHVDPAKEASAESLAAKGSVSGTHRVGFTWSLLAWMAGASLALVPTVLGMLSLWHLGRRARRVTETNWLELLQRLLVCLASKRRVTLLKSSRRRMPMTWGWLRPKLLLPEEAEEWPDERRRVVMLHELAHVQRWDYLTNLVTQITCALYWFNPLVWVAARRMVTEREQACDDMVLRQGAKPADYAGHVLQIASGLKANPFLAYGGVAMARSSKLEERLRAILAGHCNRRPVTRWAALISVIVLAAVVFPLAMMRAQAQAPAPKGPPPSFARVVERVLTAAKDEWMFDLDAGKAHGPVIIGGESSIPREMDLNVSYSKTEAGFKPMRVISINSLRTVRVENSDWELTREQVAQRLDRTPKVVVGGGDATSRSGEMSVPNDGLTRTFLFQTQDGNQGLLQVVGFSENSDGVKIRYRLAQGSVEETPPQRANASRENGELVVAEGVKTQPDRRAGQNSKTDDVPTGLAETGIAFYEAGKLQEAEAILRQAIRDDPSSKRAFYYLYLVQRSLAVGRETRSLKTRLSGITLKEVFFAQIPLSEVLRFLNQQTRGIEDLAPELAIQFTASADLKQPDNEPLITINPPLNRIRIATLLEAIVRSADRPLHYVIEEPGKVIFQKGPAALQTRFFNVDSKLFLEAIARFNGDPVPLWTGHTTGVSSQEQQMQTDMRRVFASFGVNIDPPNQIYFNPRKGLLMVRSTPRELEIIEAILKLGNFGQEAPSRE